MAGQFHLKDGTEYLPSYSWEPGMNDDLAYADRAGWQTSVEMLTTGRPEDWYCFSGPEVGNQYDLDPMGEEREMTTFNMEDPAAKGHIGIMAAEGGAGMQENASYATQSGPGDKRVALAAQNYSPGTKQRKS